MIRLARHAVLLAAPETDRPVRSRARRRTIVIAAAVAVLLAVTAGYLSWSRERAPDTAAAGAGHWVSTRGDDAAAGTAARPWRTISHAVAVAPAGSTIFVRGGTYPPFAVDRPDLTITSAPREQATIAGRAGVRDVILITAAGVSVTDLTVAGCVPKPKADVNVTGDHGSGIRVDKTTGVTIRGVTVRDGRGVNAAGLPVGCYGILATGARDLLVAASKVYHNGAGIVISRGGRGVVVDGNDVHDQDVIVQNSAAKLDDFGGYGLAATFVTDQPGPVFKNNTVQRNFGPSTDYGVDGGGVELYDAAHTTIAGNTFADNEGVLETGTGSGGACADNQFTGNTAAGRTPAIGAASNTGLVLRCGANLVVRGNTFTDLDKFTFLLAYDGDFAGSIEGMQIQGNTVTRRAEAVVYLLQFADGTSPALSIDRNRYGNGRDSFAVITDGAGTVSAESTVTFAGWRTRTGFDAASTLF